MNGNFLPFSKETSESTQGGFIIPKQETNTSNILSNKQNSTFYEKPT